MARKPAYRAARRAPVSRRSYGGSRRPVARRVSRSAVRGGRKPLRTSRGVNTLKIVVETISGDNKVARPEGIPQVETGKTKKSRF